MEYRADRFAAELMGSGEPLANALTTLKEKFGRMQEEVLSVLRDEGHDTEFIEKLSRWLDELTHPPLESRIERMQQFRG